jgi:4-amino-4-deoxy-L-arabinose transferase-like glycosyltransferase
MSKLGHGEREVLGWMAALQVVVVALPLLEYRTRDPDSVLYAEMAARLSAQPIARWVAPEWPPGWYAQGLYREHPAGIFVPPALLAGLGYPPEQAAYAVNAAYQVLTLVLVQRLAAAFALPLEARALAWLLQLVPIAFTYRVRANQEQAVVLFMVAALLGTELSRSRRYWTLLTAAGLVGLVLVKGVLGLLGPVVCALWLLTRPAPPESSRSTWTALAGAVLAVVVAAIAYEAVYRRSTGEPFLAAYLSRQLGVAAAPRSQAVLAQKAYNLAWYLARVLWFPVPWSLALLVALFSRTGRAGARTSGLAFVLAVTALYLGLFSLSDRRADRYIFPVYYVVGAAGAVAALRASPLFRGVAERLDRWHAAWPPALFLLLFALHVAGGRLLRLPTIKLWAPDS